MSAQFVVSTKVTADASQYTSEITRAGQTTATYTQQVQAADTAAQSMGSGLRTTAVAAQASSAAIAGAQQSTASAAQALTGAINNANKAHVAGTISAAQHAAAMRMLPAQITDVVTSMASGMPVWMVAIQQGGQIKDSFGGAGNAMRALLGTITPTVAAVGLLAGAAGLGALAYAQGAKEADGYRHAIVMTGNAAGTTVGQMTVMARAISASVGTQGGAAAALASFADTGQVGVENLRQFSQAAIEWERATGTAVNKTAEQFAALAKDPLNAALKLNEGTNFLTDSVYQQIKALAEQGRVSEATAVSQGAWADALTTRSAELKRHLGYVETAWLGVRDAAKWAWDSMLNVGRGTTDQQNLDQLRQNLTRLEERNATLGIKPGKQTEDLRAQVKALEEKIAAENADATAIAQGNEKRKARATWDEDGLKFLSKSAQMERELAKARGEATAAGVSEEDLQKRLAGIREKYKERKAAGGITVSDNELATLQGQLQAARLYREQLVTLGSGASELNAGERESLKIGEQLARVTDAKTTARLREKQAIADALGVQLRSNDGLEKSIKAHQANIDAAFKDADAITQRAAGQEAANATLGKSKTAIEQLTLAELQKQMAEAQASDRFDPQYIAGLELKIAAQQRYVNALGQADYKAAEQHANELLRNAQELGRAYEDEQQLSGLTTLEREKITAQRQVELRYAKELAAIDAKALSDTEKQALRDKTLEAKRIESAAAVGKAEQQAQARASEEINRSLTDALMRGFESGKGFAQNLADTTVNLFKTMVLRPTISAIMQPVSLVINGVVQQGLNAMGLGSGGGGLLSMASNASSLYSMTTGNGVLGNIASTVGGWLGLGGAASGLGLSAAAGAGTSLAAAGTGLGLTGGLGAGYGLAAGGGLGITAGSAGAGAIGAGLGSGAATAGGAAVGSGVTGALAAIPVWGWALAAVAVLGSMLSKKQTLHSGAGAIYSADEGLQEGASIYNRNTFGMGDVREYNKDGQSLASGIAKGLGTALDGLAKSFGKTAGFEVATAFADDSSKDGAWGSLRISNGGKDLLNWDDTRTSRWAPREFADGEAGQKEYLAAVAQDTRQVLLDMDLPDWADTLLTRIGEVADMDKLSAAVAQIGQVQSSFAAFGQYMPSFANLADTATSALVKASGSVEALTANMGTFVEHFYSDAEKLAVNTQNVSDAMAALGFQMPATREEFRALVQAQIALGDAGAKGLAGLLGLSGAASSVFAGAEEAARAAAQAEQQRAQAAQRAAEEAARAAAQAQKQMLDAQREALEQQRQLIEESLSNLTSVFDLVGRNARELLGQVQQTATMQSAQGRAFIAQSLAAVKSTGNLPDVGKLSEAISAVRGGIDGGAYASAALQDYDRMVVANQLLAIEAIVGPQKTAAEQQLELMKAQLKSIDDTVRAVNGTTGAVYHLNTALSAAEQQKRIEAVRSAFTSFTHDPLRVATISRAAGWSMEDFAAAFNQPLAQVQAYFSQFGINNFSDAATIARLESRYAEMKSTFATFSDDPWQVYNISKAKGWTTADIAGAYKIDLQAVRDFYLSKGIPAFATGAAFTNGVATRPTLFNMGQMGEMGPEGILPLANIGGRLGVYSTGGNDRLVSALIDEVRALRAKLGELISRQDEGNGHTGQLARQFDNLTMSGQGEIRVNVANVVSTREVAPA